MTILLPRNKERGMSSRRWKAGVWSVVPAGVPRRLVQGSGAVDRRVVGRLHDRLAAEQTPDVEGRRQAQEIDHRAGRHVWVGEPGRYAICPIHAREVGRRPCRSRLGLQAERRRRDRDQIARRTLLSYPLATAGGSRGATRRRTRETAAASPGARQSPASRLPRTRTPSTAAPRPRRGGCGIARRSHIRSIARS